VFKQDCSTVPAVTQRQQAALTCMLYPCRCYFSLLTFQIAAGQLPAQVWAPRQAQDALLQAVSR
jgi:hypothetical protein